MTALAGPSLVERSYLRAREAGDLRHEFGDVHLLLREDRARTGRRASGAG